MKKKGFRLIKKEKRFFQSGLSLIEIMIIVSLVVVLMILSMTALWGQVRKGRDARRKADLEEIKIAFEEYFNDNNCYPPSTILDNCEGTELQPYVREVPCDPAGYSYEYVPATNPCSGYRVFTQLENESDPVIEELGCTGGCGGGLDPSYNYGISVGTTLNDDNVVGSPCTDCYH